jgi:hypothetical protein
MVIVGAGDSNDEGAVLLRRPGVHVATAIEVIVDIGGGADHAAIEEDVAGRVVGQFEAG